jgi:hypothetical protein
MCASATASEHGLMQAELDGRGLAEAPRNVGLPFIEPGHLRAGFDMSGDALVWFAIWNRDRNVATAIDTSSDEVEPRAWGNHYAGPFPSRQQAREFAIEKLAAGIKGT